MLRAWWPSEGRRCMNSFGLGFTIEGFKIMTQSKKNNKMKKKIA